jgi:hypothetical protein
MTDYFIQQQIAEFVCKYPSAAPKRKIAKKMPKVAQSAVPTPVPKKSDVIQLQCTNFPKKDSESSKDSDYTEDSEDSEDSEDLNDTVSDKSLYESDESSDDLSKNAKFLFMCAWQEA